jgi:elongation factor Ts
MVKNLRERTGAGMMECKTALTESNGDVEAAIEYLRKRGMAQAAKRAGRVASEGLVGIKLNDDRTLGVMAEVNCETDFVARNDGFKALVDEVTTTVFTSDQPHAALVAPDGPIGTRITAEIAKVGENMGVPRTAKLTADHIGSYSHMGGKIGVLVQLQGATGEATTTDAFKAFVTELAMHIAAAAPQYLTRAEVPAEAVEKEKEIYRAQMAESGKPANVIEKIIEGKLGAFYEQVCLVDQPTIRDPKVKVSQALATVSKAVGAPVTITGFARFKVGEASQS